LGLFDRARDTADRLSLREALAEEPPVARPSRTKKASAEKPLAPVRVEFALVKVRAEPVAHAVQRVQRVVDLAGETKATVTVLGAAVLIYFAYPVTHRPTQELETFVASVQEALGEDGGVVYGVEQCMCGTYGGTRQRVFGPIIPNLLLYLKRLAELTYGISMRV
jgi:hypothetical protein